MNPPQKQLLCVDDDNDTCELVEFLFKQIDYQVISCHSYAEGLRLAQTGKFRAIILDYRIVGAKGTQLCREIRKFDARTPIVFFTASAYREEREEALAAGAQAYLVKPDDLYQLTETVLRLIKRSEEEASQEYLS